MEISEIKSRLPITQVITHYGYKLDRNNRMLCPWHKDKTPSLQIYPKTNTWTCFSSKCSAGSGDQIEFVQREAQCSKHEAIMKCKAMLGVVVTKQQKSRTEDLSRIAVLSNFYMRRATNTRSGKGKAYAESRGLKYPTELYTYCGTEMGRKSNADLQAQMQKLGLERFKRCLLFAMRNAQGQIVSLYGRHTLNNDTGKHFYLSGEKEGLYPRWPAADCKHLILTESLLDTATLIQYHQGSQSINYLALYGTNGFTVNHKEAIKGLKSLEEITLFMDGDQAGDEALPNLAEKIKAVRSDIKISYVETPRDEDPNSLCQGHESAIFTHLLDHRKPLVADIFSSNEESIENKKIEEKQLNGKLVTENEELLVYHQEPLQILILGGIRIAGLDRLRVTLKITRANTDLMPLRYTLDLYHNKQVEQLSERMAAELKITQLVSRRIISDLTESLEQYRYGKQATRRSHEPQAYQMSAVEEKEAIKYLKGKKLMERTLKDFERSGIVGELQNAMIGHIIYLSRKRNKPMHVMYLGSSGAGKTYLQEKLSAFIPREDKKSVTALSDQSLYYQAKQLKNKVLLIEDLDGAENVLFVIRELQTKGWISKTVVWRDSKGKMQSVDVIAEGPVCISSCTTREKLYEDNANRCILLYIDESKNQDEKIMAYQKKKSAGLIKTAMEVEIQKLHQNIQRVLLPIEVINPYAELISLPAKVFKPRRTLQILLSFIETVTFYHQYQRDVKIDKATGIRFIESTVEDVEWSFRLLRNVLFNKSDELNKATRDFLEKLKEKVGEDQSFYTQEIRKAFRLSSTTIHRYVRILKAHGYIEYKGGNRHRGYEYQIVDYDEYAELKGEINRLLDDILANIRQKNGIPQVFHSENGTPKQQKVNALA